MRRFVVHSGSRTHRAVSLPGFRVTDSTFPAGMASRLHEHARAVLSVTLTGRFENELPRRGEDRGAAAFAKPPGEPHRNRVGTVPSRVLSIEPLDETLDRLGPRRSLFERGGAVADPRIGELGWRLARELDEPDDLWTLAAEGLVIETLAVAARAGGRRPHGRPRWLSDVLEILHERFREGVRLADLAAEVGIESRALAEGFREHQQVTIGAYTRRLRLDWACRRLAAGVEPISAVAVAAGYSDQSHLTREMKRALGVTPAEYRRSRG